MEYKGLFYSATVENFQKENNTLFIEMIEGVLIDNILFYNPKYDMYYMCKEHFQNEWTSCYEVYCGREKEIYNEWEELKEHLEELKE